MIACLYINIQVVTFAFHYNVRLVTSSLQYATLSSNGLVVKIGWMMRQSKVAEKRYKLVQWVEEFPLVFSCGLWCDLICRLTR